MGWLSDLFSADGFVPRANCGNWSPWMIGVQNVSDAIIALSYYAIPVLIGCFAYRRRDLPFRHLMILFVAFILACGTTHLLEVVIFYHPLYPLVTVVKAATAGVSLLTAAVLAPSLPAMLRMKSPGQLEKQVKQHTSELAETSQFLDLLFHQAQIGFGQLDRHLRYVRANEHLAAFNGRPIEAVIGRPVSEAVAGLSEARMTALRRVLVTGQKVLPTEIEVTRDGVKKVYMYSLFPVFCGPAVTSIGEVVTDISQEREEGLKKDEFLALLGHELRNPLAPVSNALQLLKHHGQLTPTCQYAWQVISRQLQHLVRLVDDLLDISRITSGQINLMLAAVDYKAVVEQAVEQIRPLYEAHRHTLVVDAPEAIAGYADFKRLVQVVTNLLTNAAKYTPEGGTVKLVLVRQSDIALIRVSDTGEGIAPDLLPHIFDPFTQGSRNLARSQGGLGIGLTLVKTLVELHGGTVTAHSPGAGKGSEFVISLPAFNRPSPEPMNDSGIKFALPNKRIVVVDDNVDNAVSAGMLLRTLGYHVEEAHNGTAGISVVDQIVPDAVLLDIGLPDLNGYEVCKRIKEKYPNILLIAMTGYGQDKDRQKGLEAGFDHYLVKPVDPIHLSKILNGQK